MKRAIQSGGKVQVPGRIYSLAERVQLLKDLKAKREADAQAAKDEALRIAALPPATSRRRGAP